MNRAFALSCLGLAMAGLLSATAPAAYAVEDVECPQTSLDDAFSTSRDSRALVELDLDESQYWLRHQGEGLGAGVVVAVVDSGVGAPDSISVLDRPVVVPGLTLQHYHGTAVAGLIAGAARSEAAGGPVGIAPDAQILDLQVYDDPSGESGTPIVTANVIKALDQVLVQRRAGVNVRVVNISLNVAPDEELQQRIDRLWQAGVVTVAPTGNRPSNEPGDTGSELVPEEDFGTFQPGENARDVVHPAAYEHVLAVNASMAGGGGDDPHRFVLENSSTDLAAATANGVSYSVNGGTCLLTEPSTSWAAAEVSGVLALQFAHFPDDTPAMAVNRLLLTADGRPDIPNSLSGAGDVQPYDALTRPLTLGAQGEAQQTAPEPDIKVYAVPEPEPDVLAATRHVAVWWGLLGGGALLLALVLRPVLTGDGERRPTDDRRGASMIWRRIGDSNP